MGSRMHVINPLPSFITQIVKHLYNKNPPADCIDVQDVQDRLVLYFAEEMGSRGDISLTETMPLEITYVPETVFYEKIEALVHDGL